MFKTVAGRPPRDGDALAGPLAPADLTLPADHRSAPPRAPFLARALAAAASAILLTLANPPADLGWLAWLAPVPFFWALIQGSGFGVGGSEGGVQAFRHSGIQDGPQSPTPIAQRPRPAILAFLHGFLFLMLLAPWFGAFSPAGYPVAGIYWGLLASAVWSVTLRIARGVSPAWLPPLLAAGWTLWEWLRAQGTLAFPWGTLSVTQHRYLPVLQILDVTGAYGLSFLMALFAASVAALLARYRSGRTWAGAAIAATLLCFVRGEMILRGTPPAAETARVAVVQASESVQEGVAVRCVSRPEEYAERTRAAVGEGAELVVWPETARVDDVVRSGQARNEIATMLMGSRAYLLTGSFVDDPESGQTMNAGVMLDSQAEVRGQYAKVLIVPFGEYLPLRPLLRWTEALGMPPTDLRPGDGFHPLAWDKGRMGVSICFESAFGGVSREHVRRGANLLANLTSDGWVGRTAAGYQHAGFAPLRAVENRRAMARSAATGISALIDPNGRRIRQIPMFQKGYAVADLPLRTDLTLYTRLGDWPVLFSFGLLVLAGVAAVRRRRSSG